MNTSEAYKEFVGQEVVVDVESPVVYIGRLVEADSGFVTLAEVDIHDLRISTTSKEVYVMEAKRFGVQPNRKLIKIVRNAVLSLSRLEDVIVY